MEKNDLLAVQEAKSLNVAPAEVFVGQFVIDKLEQAPFEGYETRAIADRWLHFCPTLDLCVLNDRSGHPIAWLIGIALDETGQRLDDGTVVDITGHDGVQYAIETLIVKLTGRYMVVSQAGGVMRAYTDAVGEMGVVYDTQTGLVGSTLPLVMKREIIDRDDINHEAVMESRGHYALGYTRDRFCERLMPNHRLDLASMTQTRFWPQNDSEWEKAAELPFDDMIDELLAILRRNTVGFLTSTPSVFPLSGGQDSRMLITAARDHVHLAKTIFGMHHNWASGRDCDVGSQVAARLGLDYLRITAPKAGKWGRRAFHSRVGYAVNSGGIQSLSHVHTLPKGHLVIRGNVMGLTRANDWGPGQNARAWDDVTFGISRLMMGAAISVEQQPVDLEHRYLAWRDSLPGFVRCRSHDMSFCENYLPNSLGARNYGYTNVVHVNPFASRRAIMIVSATDPQSRKNNRINNKMLEITAPDLADIRLV